MEKGHITSKTINVCNEDQNLGIDSFNSFNTRDLPRMMFHNKVLTSFLEWHIKKWCSPIVDAYKQAYEELQQKYKEKRDDEHFDEDHTEQVDYENTDSTPSTPNSTSSHITLSQELKNIFHTQECNSHDL